MQIRFSGTYSPRHLVQIGNAISRLLGGGGVIRRAGGLGIFGAALIMFPIASVINGAPLSVLTWIPIGVITLGLVALNEWAIRRQLARGPLVNQAVFGTIGHEGFTIDTPNTSSTIRWPAVRGYAERSSHLLLLDQSNAVFGIARDFFATTDEYQQAVAIVCQFVTPARSRLITWNRVFRAIVWVVLIVMVFLLWSLFRTGA
jgi:hypothetical protein